MRCHNVYHREMRFINRGLMLCNGNISSMYQCTSYANIILSLPAIFPGVFLSPQHTTLYEWALFKEKQVHVTCISVDVWHTSASLHRHHMRFLPLALCGYMWSPCGGSAGLPSPDILTVYSQLQTVIPHGHLYWAFSYTEFEYEHAAISIDSQIISKH